MSLMSFILWILRAIGFIRPVAPNHDSGAPEGAFQNKNEHR